MTRASPRFRTKVPPKLSLDPVFTEVLAKCRHSKNCVLSKYSALLWNIRALPSVSNYLLVLSKYQFFYWKIPKVKQVILYITLLLSG